MLKLNKIPFKSLTSIFFHNVFSKKGLQIGLLVFHNMLKNIYDELKFTSGNTAVKTVAEPKNSSLHASHISGFLQIKCAPQTSNDWTVTGRNHPCFSCLA